LRRLLLLAVVALGRLATKQENLVKSAYFTASNLEGGDNSIPYLQILHSRAHGLDHATKLVTKDVSFFHLNDRTMQQMQVTPADSTSRNFNNDISVLHNAGFWDFVCIGCETSGHYCEKPRL
jgi:hypothetical protein